MLDQISHPFGSGTNYRSTRGKSFEHGNRHVIKARSIDEDISAIVVPTDLLSRSYTAEIDALDLQLENQLPYILFERPSTDEIKLRLRELTLHQRKGFNDHIDAIIRMKATGTN